MRRFARAATAITLTLGLVVAAPLGASANDTPTVDYEEFDAARVGHTTTRVAQIFDSPGIISSRTERAVVKKYRKAVGDQTLAISVVYLGGNGVYKLAIKQAFWSGMPDQRHNPATTGEYVAIKAGMTIPQVRAIVGSRGTRWRDLVEGDYSTREYLWPVSTRSDGRMAVEFTMKNGVFVVSRKSASW